MSLERIEEWLSRQEPVLRGRLSKAIQSFVAILGPLLIWLSEIPKMQKAAWSLVYVLTLLDLWLLSWLAIYRTKARLLKVEAERAPELPLLDGSDTAVLMQLVVYDKGCGVDRIASDFGKGSWEISHSMDKLAAHDFVVKLRDDSLSGAEYRATPKGRDRCANPKKYLSTFAKP